MEVFIDYKALKGGHNETIINELAVVAVGVIRTLHFQATFDMRPHGSAKNRLNLDAVHRPYQIQTSVTEAVAG